MKKKKQKGSQFQIKPVSKKLNLFSEMLHI